MRKWLFVPVLCLLCLLPFTGLGQETQMVNYYNASFPVDAEYIDLGSQRVMDWDQFYAFLRKFPNLKKVDIFSTEVYRTRINEFKAQFPDVEFGMTMRISEHTIRTDQTAFSTLHNNRSTPHTSADFSILRYCTRLLALDIGHNLVEDISFLHYTPQLRVLILACNINLEDISVLGELKHLEYLELFKNNIKDISCLAGLTELRDLNICFNRIRDYTPLMGLTQLERLWLYNSNNYSADIPVPAATVVSLREALPGCQVDAVSYSTLGGWREHERYDIINRMFETQQYIPFSFSPPVTEATFLFSGGRTVVPSLPVADDPAAEPQAAEDSQETSEEWQDVVVALPEPDAEPEEDDAAYTFE